MKRAFNGRIAGLLLLLVIISYAVYNIVYQATGNQSAAANVFFATYFALVFFIRIIAPLRSRLM